MTGTEGPQELTCAECGATILVPPTLSLPHCPFCGAPQFGPGPVRSAAPPLSTLIPFALPTERVAAIYRQWLGTRLFRPHGVNRTASGHLHAIYIPAWLCRATATSVWTILNDEADTDSPAADRHVAAYPHILISASRGLPADWLIHAGGFDLGQQRPVHQATVRDRLLEIAAVDCAAALGAARQQIEASERAACAVVLSEHPEATTALRTTIDKATAELVGLPIWLANFSFRGTRYQCLINGQTGTVYGDAPVSGTKIAVLVGVVILAIVAVLIVTQLYGS